MASFDNLVDVLAFGKETPKPSPGLGLYLSPEIVYLSDSHLEKDGRLVVDHLVRIPIAAEGKTAGSAATMNTDFLSDPLKIAGPIQQSMSSLRWSSKKVRVTLSHHLGLMRYFAMPEIDRRFWKSAVPLEAKKSIPIPFETLAYDYAAAPLAPDAAGKHHLGVLIAATQKKNIANVRGLLDALGLTLDGLEVAPCSVLRLWQLVDPPEDPTPFLHVHIDGGSVRVMVVDGGVPVFFREVFLPQDATGDDLRKIDLPGCLSYAQKQLGVAGIGRLRVSGNLANLEAMKDAFSRETGLPAVLQDTPKLLGVKTGDWGGYAALGASAQSLRPAAAALDMAAVDRITDEERHTARDIMIAGAALAVFLAGAGLFQSATYSLRARELHKYQNDTDPGAAGALQGLSSYNIEDLLREMQSQLGQLRMVTGLNHLKTSDVLKEIIAVMPDAVWIDHLELRNPLAGADAKPMAIAMRGHAHGNTVADEQALAFRFHDAMVKDPQIGKDFEVSISLEGQAGGDRLAADTSGLDARALANKLEERTMFLLELKAKH